jgi:hypothetical protein
MKKYAFKLLIWVLIIIIYPISYIGKGLYLISKVIRSLGYLLMFKPASARAEYERFFTVSFDLGDL